MPDATSPPGDALPPPSPPGTATPWVLASSELPPPSVPPVPSVPPLPPLPPVPPVPPARASTGRRPRRGRLTAAWRAMMVTTWVGVFLAFLAVWKASEEIGLATWWLGPRSDPQPVVVRLVPFVVTAVFGILASYNVPRMPLIGIAGAVAIAAIAVPDLSRSIGLATVEFAIAVAVLLVSAASFTGTYRQPTSHGAG